MQAHCPLAATKGLFQVKQTSQNAFHGVVSPPISGRRQKPRTTGHTMIIDKGIGIQETGDLLELAGAYIDYVKFGFGTAALYPEPLLRAKIALIRSYGISAYPGGTFLEVALTQNALAQYLETARSFGFDFIEVSDGTITMTQAERRAAIEAALAAGFQVITEVGKKDGAVELAVDEALSQIRADLALGAAKVIVEGRESGKGVGIYDKAGRLKADYLDELAGGLPDPSVLMWEAPLKVQQEELIIRFGPNVNLGNIQPGEAIALEALRTGLRGDTLKVALEPKAAGAGARGD